MAPLVHYCLRAAPCVGPGPLADYLLPAVDAMGAGRGSSSGSGSGSRQLAVGSSSEKPRRTAPGREFGSVWEALPYLGEAPLEALTLVAHGAQIAADEHVKQGSIQRGILKALSSSGQWAVGSKEDLSRGAPGSTGDRGWLLDKLEQASEITIPLLLWADNFRMLYRTAGEEHYPLLKELAETRLAGLANEK